MSATPPAGSTSRLVATGPVPASVMVFGESPLRARRTLGPRPDPGELLLRRALADVGIEPAAVRFTSAVKPGVAQADQAGPASWVAPLVAEVRRVRPCVLVLLGPSTGRTMLGARYAPRRQRGLLLPAPSGFGFEGAPQVLVTAHPSSVHRSRHRTFAYTAMVRDLRAAACLLLPGALAPTGDEGVWPR
ncbi:MAG: uracil-DNA glycosylase family protein [Terracoccus sp.]